MPEFKQYVSTLLYNQFMTKSKRMCCVCGVYRYLRGFTGKGKRRNRTCNICLFKYSREPLYMTNESLDAVNQPRNPQALKADDLNYKLEQDGYWFEED